MTPSPEAVLQTIPGWETASWKTIDGGLTNRAMVVEKGGVQGLLKVDAHRRGIPFVDRLEEARLQRVAAERGLANIVLFANETILLTEYREGTVWSPQHFDNDDNLVRLAKALKKLHALPRTGRRFDAVAAAESYMTRLGDADRMIAKQCLQTIHRIPAAEQVCCCHNDLVAENILEADGIRFLDWEYAADNDPLFDIATVVAHHGLSERQAEVLLDACLHGDSRSWRKPLAEQVRLYEALCWLWEAANTR